MSLGFDRVQALTRAGRFAEIASGLPTPDALQALQPLQRMVYARALVHAYKHGPARAIIEAENRPEASPAIRAVCELLLGWIARSSLDLTGSRSHYELSLKLAREGTDHATAGWAAIQLLRSFAESPPSSNAVAAILPDVRRQVIRAGDPQLSAYMHNTVAMLEAANGRLTEARRHLRMSAELLAADPNEFLLQINCLGEFFLEFHSCNYKRALKFLDKARSLVATVGDQQRFVIDANYGHVLALVGRFDAAIRLLTSVFQDSQHVSRVGALDGVAGALLAMGRVDECEATLHEMWKEGARDPVIAASYWYRWTAITRLKLLLAKREYQTALGEAESLERRIIADPLLTEHISLLRAEAAALTGDTAAAAALLLSCASSAEASSPAREPAYYRAAARALAATEDPLFAPMRDRAAAVWTEYGNVAANKELGQLGLPEQHEENRAWDKAAHVVTSVAAAFRFAANPTLLARELKQVMAALDCECDIEFAKHATRPARAARVNSFVVGTIGDATLHLNCGVVQTPKTAILLGDALRLARAALELERYRQEDRNRAALWPADPIETEAGALFLAEEMQALLTTARRIAPTTVPVLITGETGTGKEVLARLIHAYSNRAKHTFLPFNCSATPKDMLDSQLFGHRRGSFTGASDNFQGVIRAAGGGTLLLDEIGETTLDVQPKLLRFLESGEVHPIGEAQPVKADVRIIAATNADLDTLVSEGRFRDDLFYRLNIVRLHLPPLRERRVEIPALANHYLRKYAKENAKGDLRLAEETMEYLVLYRWPGNVRQLANEMRRLAALAESGAVLMPEHLSNDIFSSRKTIPASERTLEPTELVVRLDQPMAAAVQHVERAMIIYAMKKCGGGMEETASLLGLSRKGLYLKRQRYEIETPGEGAIAVA